ncbi:MAG TPA: hypothetical protein VG872_08035 [Acidimicrobiia bacterium]|jgi:hypothetical protein|nr:hypothetical protein [Acidimicrobiia bacterium]
MSDQHKAALAQGRREARAIKAYLKVLSSRRPGRPVSKASLSQRLDRVTAKLAATADPLEKVDLIQSRLDIEEALAELNSADDLDSLESEFKKHVASYSKRKGVTYTAWRESGVPAKVLREAGIKETRRR